MAWVFYVEVVVGVAILVVVTGADAEANMGPSLFVIVSWLVVICSSAAMIQIKEAHGKYCSPSRCYQCFVIAIVAFVALIIPFQGSSTAETDCCYCNGLGLLC